MKSKLAIPPTTSSPASLRVVEPEALRERMNEIYDSIAQRAFEFFEEDGRTPGHDRDHWLKAEEELLHRVHVTIAESDGTLTVQAEVPGFDADELQVCLEPWCLTIGGRKSREKEKVGSTIYRERCSSEILRVIDMPTEIDPSKATAFLKNGVLELMIPKLSHGQTAQVAAKAA